MDNRAIGVFDSGIGGLTAVSKILEIMPGENVVYLGDTARVPYGTRSVDTVLKYTNEDINFLLKYNPKIIIAACGTVSSVALKHINIDIPIIGVVRPAIDKALEITKTGRVGVIGTKGTISSGAYQKGLGDKHTLSKACPLFVPFAENGRFKQDDILAKMLIKEYLSEFKTLDIDTLILGCTHYPLLSGLINEFFQGDVHLINPGEQAVIYANSIIDKADDKAGEINYFVTDDVNSFKENAAIFLGKDIDNVGLIHL